MGVSAANGEASELGPGDYVGWAGTPTGGGAWRLFHGLAFDSEWNMGIIEMFGSDPLDWCGKARVGGNKAEPGDQVRNLLHQGDRGEGLDQVSVEKTMTSPRILDILEEEPSLPLWIGPEIWRGM